MYDEKYLEIHKRYIPFDLEDFRTLLPSSSRISIAHRIFYQRLVFLFQYLKNIGRKYLLLNTPLFEKRKILGICKTVNSQ